MSLIRRYLKNNAKDLIAEHVQFDDLSTRELVDISRCPNCGHNKYKIVFVGPVMQFQCKNCQTKWRPD